MSQTILTFISSVSTNRRKDLENILDQFEDKLQANNYYPFASLTKLHFASFSISNDERFESLLIFENNFDDSLDAYMDDLLTVAGLEIHEIYQCCSDYFHCLYDRNALTEYLKAKIILPNAWHIGNVGRTVARVQQEIKLLSLIQNYLDVFANIPNRLDAENIRKAILEFVLKSDSNYKKEIQSRQSTAERILPHVRLYFFVVLIFLLLPLIIPLLTIWFLILRFKERGDAAIKARTAYNHHYNNKLLEREDLIVQNHFASITIIKPGWIRKVTLTSVLWLTNLVARISTKGELAGIPSIHFAHWSIIDEGRRLLFLSNYDGSWASYLDDFIDKSSRGLTAIWSNTTGFPETEFLLLKGARNEASFKSFARNSQLISRVWYSAYPHLTVQHIDKQSLIRENLNLKLTLKATKKWLKLF